MSKVNKWYTKSIFISSTFRDMQAERDVIMNKVFPVLEERLRERFHHLELVDLRWGVETISIKEVEEKELCVLKVCLDEIDRCKPFLIILLGDRYGWVPGSDRLKAAAAEKRYEYDVDGRSITALEIEYGILKSPEKKKRSFFYFREPLPYEEMTEEKRKEYCSKYNEEGYEGWNRLQKLKQDIRDSMGDRVRTYSTVWDKENQKVTGLEKLAEMIVEDIWKDLDEETKQLADKVVTWQEEEAQIMESFIADRTRSFAGREDLLNRLMNFALCDNEESPKYCIITGTPGSGKSAVFAYMVEKLRENKKDCVILPHTCGISTRSGSVDAMLRMWIRELCSFLNIEDTSSKSKAVEENIKLFSDLLSSASHQTRVIILIDALNQLERTTIAKYVQWMPEIWPKNVRLIATAIEGIESETLSKKGAKVEVLTPLDNSEIERIIGKICETHHKKLNLDVLKALTEKTDDKGSRPVQNPLYLNIALQDLMLMDEDDFRHADKDYEGTAEERLDKLLMDSVKNMPAAIEEMYGYLLRRAEKRFGEKWVRSIVGFLGISRFGLRTNDLEKVVAEDTRQDWDSLKFAALRRFFRAHIIQRGDMGLWDFTHNQFRSGVQKYILDEEKMKELNIKLAKHLESLPGNDQLKLKEIMYHYYMGDMVEKAAIYYGQPLIDDFKFKYSTYVLKDIIVMNIGKSAEKCLYWPIALLNAANLDYGQLFLICNTYNYELTDLLKGTIPLGTIVELLESVLKKIEAILSIKPNNKIYERFLFQQSVACENIGKCNEKMGRLKEAEAYYIRTLEIRENLYLKNPDDENAARDVFVIYNNLGKYNEKMGRLKETEACYRKAMGISEELFRRNPESADSAGNVYVCLTNFANYLVTMGRLKEADLYYKRALEISEELYCKNTRNDEAAKKVSVCCTNLGNFTIRMGRLKEAEAYYSRALKINEELYYKNPESIDMANAVALCCRNFGLYSENIGKLKEAEVYYYKAFGINEELYRRNPESADAAREASVSCNNLGNFNIKMERFEEADEYYRRAIEISEKLYKKNPESAHATKDLYISYKLYGISCNCKGRFTEAEESYKRALEISEELLGKNPENADTARDVLLINGELAYYKENGGKFEEAEAHYYRAMKISEELYLKNPESADAARDVFSVYLHIGGYYSIIGKLAEAGTYFKRSVEISEGLYHRNPESEKAKNDLFTCYKRFGDYLEKVAKTEEAEGYYRDALIISNKMSLKDSESKEAKKDLEISLHKLEGQTFEKLAEASHTIFCNKLKEKGYKFGLTRCNEEPNQTHPLLIEYEKLPEYYKESYREEVRDIPEKLARINCVMTAATEDKVSYKLEQKEIEYLAQLEHDRYIQHAVRNGWHYEEVKEKQFPADPTLLPWNKMSEEEKRKKYSAEIANAIGLKELPENEKKKDRELIEAIPYILEKAGFIVEKLQSE